MPAKIIAGQNILSAKMFCGHDGDRDDDHDDDHEGHDDHHADVHDDGHLSSRTKRSHSNWTPRLKMM